MKTDKTAALLLTSNSGLSGRIESCGPDKNLLMSDIYGNEYSPTVPILKILGDSSTEEPEGFNPYDTAVFVKK